MNWRFHRLPVPEHLRVPWGIGAALGVFVLSWIVLPALIVLIAALLSYGSPRLRAALDTLQSTSPNLTLSFALALFSAIAGLALILAILRRRHVGISALGWRRFNFFKAALYLLAVYVVFFIVANGLIYLVSLLVPAFDANQAQSNDFLQSHGASPGLVLTALVLLPPIIEESVYRGFIFPAFANRWGTMWGAVISSSLFGLAHLQANVSIYTFILGMVLCFLYTRLKSIFPGMILHMLNNYLALVLLGMK